MSRRQTSTKKVTPKKLEDTKIMKEPEVKEDEPNKGWSFVVGIFICIAIIIVFVIFFNH